MVPIDLYRLVEKTKKEMIKRLEEINIELYPVDFAWLLYALQNEKNTPLFLENLNRLKKWSISDISGKNDRDIGALALCALFRKKFDKMSNTRVLEKIRQILKRNVDKLMFKHSVINDPGEMFLLSLISDLLDKNLKTKLSEIIIKNLNGTISRKILFSATSINLGIKVDEIKKTMIISSSIELERIEDMIAMIWFLKRYKKFKIAEKIPEIWDKILKEFPNIEDENNRIILSTQNLALIHEAVNIELQSPDPFFIFSLYPLEEDIRKICLEHFKNEKYSTAVFQASLKLLELIKNKAKEFGTDTRKIEKLKERDLIRELMNPRKFINGKFKYKSEDEIAIKFNPLLDQTSGKNEQEGLALIVEGVLVAFRHPRGHNPEDHELVKIRPYEALAQLVLIDYLWKRIKSAKICGDSS